MFTETMLESIKKVEATRAERLKQVLAGNHPRRMTAEEKETLLATYHPDYKQEQFTVLQMGPNKGEKAPKELTELLHSNSRLLKEKVDLSKVDYDFSKFSAERHMSSGLKDRLMKMAERTLLPFSLKVVTFP